MMKQQTITGLWVGDALPLISVLCIKSFLDHGHRFQLFTYKSFDNIPEGTIIRDANDILPQELIFRDCHNSLATFSDWFRMEWLFREGGFWVDMDVACLRDDLPEERPWFCLQEPGVVAVGAIAFPPQHPMIDALRRIAADPASPAPWDRPEERRQKEAMKRNIPAVEERRRHVPWGHCGPQGFTRALRHFELQHTAKRPSQLYPIHYTVWRHCYNGVYNLNSAELGNAWAIHLWGEMLRREPDAFENVSRNSVVGELLDKHLPGHECVAVAPAPEQRQKVRVLVGICSCNSAAHRRKACRETWISHQVPGIECRFFLGRREPIAHEPDVVTLWVADTYSHLPAKGLEFYKYALEHYDFDWLYKCDDDTYLALGRLESLCDDRYDLIGDMSLKHRGSPSGGAGYLMKRSLVEKLVAHGHELSPTGPEDVLFGKLAHKLGARMHATPRLFLDQCPSPLKNNDLVSCHWCSPVRLHEIENTFYATPLAIMHGKHPHWEDDILLFSNGRFRRCTSGCSGSYSLEDDCTTLTLCWDNWPKDVLVRRGSVFSKGAFSISEVEGQPSLFSLSAHQA